MSRSATQLRDAGELPDVPPDLLPPCAVEGTDPEQVLDEVPDLARTRAFRAGPTELDPLLRYLQVSPETFAAREQRYFGALGAHLRRAGAVAEAANVDRSTYRDAVRAFQRARGLEPDGIPGQDVCWELQKDWSEARGLAIERVDADVVGGSEGYDRFYLRSDAVDAYEALRRDVRAAGGVVSSAGAFRTLGATVSAGRSRTSMHYTGLALDLALDTGMRDPLKDPYVVTQDGRKWRLWCRSASAPAQTLDAVVWRRGATEVRRVTVSAFDFTEIAQRFGFARIGPRGGFPGEYLCAEWWHFQYELALVPWISQFGIELLGIASFGSGGGAVVYDEKHLGNYDLWDNRKRMFQRPQEGWW
jgi:peptidoglycan hydrolase-like protein with peptidoglycan-binding domain